MNSHERSVSPMRDEDKCLKMPHKTCRHVHEAYADQPHRCESMNTHTNVMANGHMQHIQQSVDAMQMQLHHATRQVEQMRQAFEELRRRKQKEQHLLRLQQERHAAKLRQLHQLQMHRARVHDHSRELDRERAYQHQTMPPTASRRRLIQLPSLRKHLVDSSASDTSSNHSNRSTNRPRQQHQRQQRLQQCLQLQHERRQYILKTKFRDQMAIV